MCLVGRKVEYRLKNRAFRMIELLTRDRRSTAHSSPVLAAAVAKRLGQLPAAPFESPEVRVGSLRSTAVHETEAKTTSDKN